MKAAQFARENGWLLLFQRILAGAFRRLRDGAVSRKLGADGFRCGARPRLLGLAHMRVGRNFKAGDSLWLEAVTEYAGEAFSPQLTIGDNVSASDNVHIACTNRLSIGAGTLLGSRVILSDHTHGLYRGDLQSLPSVPPTLRPLSRAGSVIVGANVWIGDGVAVLSGANIGDGCIIGANSVVTGVIPPGTIAVGAPARPIRRWDAQLAQWVAIEGPLAKLTP